MAEIPTSVLPLNFIAPVVETRLPGSNSPAGSKGISPADLPGSPENSAQTTAEGTETFSFDNILDQLAGPVPAAAQSQAIPAIPATVPAPETAPTARPPPGLAQTSLLPPAHSPLELTTESEEISSGEVLPANGKDLPDGPVHAPAPGDLQHQPTLTNLPPLKAAAPLEAEQSMDALTAVTTHPTAQTAPPPQSQPLKPPPAAAENASAMRATSGAESDSAMNDQSADFTSDEQHTAELAAKLTRAQADRLNESMHREFTRGDLSKAWLVDHTRGNEPITSPLLHTARLSPLDAATSQNLTLQLPAERANWPEPLAQRIAWLIRKGSNTAELRLNPPHLGRLEVQLSMHGDQASVVLSASSQEVRDALQQSLPHLNNLLQSSGLELADSHITDEGFNPSPDNGGEQQSHTAEHSIEPPRMVQRVLEGLIDTYA